MAETKGFAANEEALQGSDEELLAKFGSWFEAAKKNRQILDWQWYIYQNYYKGNHYIQFNKKTNQIITPPRPKGQVRVTINKIYSISRAIRNFATSYRPKWSVVASSTTEEEVNNGKKSADTLDSYYDRLNMPRVNKILANYMIKYGGGYYQYGWDDEAEGFDNQMGECWVIARDPFDVYPDPAGMDTGDIQNCRFVDIAVSKPIQDIVNNPHYKIQKEDIGGGDIVRAASEFKQQLIRQQYADNFAGNDELATKILHETWYKVRAKVNDGYESQVWIASWVDGKLLRNEQTEFDEYPLIFVPSDDNGDELFGEGYIKNLIPVVKVLNRLESQVVEYNNIVNRGRLIADKDSGVSKITNETAEIIEKNAGADVREMTHGGLAPDMPQQISRLNQYIDELSGVTDAFQGDKPAGVTAGVAIESLKAQSANNLQDLKDNLEFGMARLGEAILKLLANKLVVSRTIQSSGKDGSINSFSIKGQVGVQPKEELPENTYVIGNQNQVKVTIGSDLAYTREGRLNRLDKLLEMKVIDPQTYLEALEFGNVDEIMERANKAQFQDAMLQNMVKGGGALPGMPGAPAGGIPPTMGGQPPVPAGGQAGGDSWTKLADDEDNAMLQGHVVPPTQGAPKEHTAIHIAWSQSPEVTSNDNLAKALLDHIKGEEQLQGLGSANVPAGQ